LVEPSVESPITIMGGKVRAARRARIGGKYLFLALLRLVNIPFRDLLSAGLTVEPSLPGPLTSGCAGYHKRPVPFDTHAASVTPAG
jgi:hypothetical protein